MDKAGLNYFIQSDVERECVLLRDLVIVRRGLAVTLRPGSLLRCTGEAFRTVLIDAKERRRNGMLEDKLVQSAGFQDNGIFIKGTHSAGKFYAVEQMHGNMLFSIQRSVEKRLLDIADMHDRNTQSISSSSRPLLPTTLEANDLDKIVAPRACVQYIIRLLTIGFDYGSPSAALLLRSCRNRKFY